jgi:hypothetical protein
MANLALAALRQVCSAALRGRAALERTLHDLDPASDDAHELGGEWVQMIKVEGELYDADTEALATSDMAFPSWDELADAAAAG